MTEHVNFDNFSFSNLNNSPLKYLSINIRSYSKNFSLFLAHLYTSNLHNFFDFIFLSECWLTSDTLIKDIGGYESFKFNSKTNKCSGIICYVKESILARKHDMSLNGVCDLALLDGKILMVKLCPLLTFTDSMAVKYLILKTI